jgi:hypothetical protein
MSDDETTNAQYYAHLWTKPPKVRIEPKRARGRIGSNANLEQKAQVSRRTLWRHFIISLNKDADNQQPRIQKEARASHR